MTPRALLIGFVFASLLAGFTYFNDFVLKQTFLIGTQVPIIVYGLLIVFIVTINPLLRRFGENVALRGRELAVILGITTVVCVIPGSGLLRYFIISLIMPHYEAQTQAGGIGEELIGHIPTRMLADPTAHPDALPGYLQGLGVGEQGMQWSQVPWEAWLPTLLLWLPLLMVFWIGLIALALVFHTQWSKHEHLPYPIARIANEMLPTHGEKRHSIYSNRWFWIPFAIVLAIHFNNFLVSHYPQLIAIKLGMDLNPVMNPLDWRFRGPASMWSTLNFTIYFSAIAIAFFLPRQISLSIGLAPFCYGLVAGTLGLYGINMAGGGAYAPRNLFSLGAFLGIFLMVVYTGRYFYLQVTKRALGMGKPGEVPAEAVWGARIFVLCFLLSVIWFSAAGLSWPITFLVLGLILVTYIVLSRIFAETGMFIIQPVHSAPAMLLVFFGAQTVGPDVMMIVGLLWVVFMADPREALMPYVVNAFKLLEHRNLSPARFAPWAVAVLLLGLLIAVPATLYWQYEGGSRNVQPISVVIAMSKIFPEAIQVHQRLDAQGALESSLQASGWEALRQMRPHGTGLVAFGLGLAAVIGFSLLRLRIPAWPLHPVIFAIWAAWGTAVFSISFLIGWFLKGMVSKYGGEKAVNHVKPAMVGLVAGEFMGAILPVLINWGYYWFTGENPPHFIVLPS
ncbi:MAG: hypothetical protein EA425_07785 [Puniceicoccaceae bacterium]|nr:MAG: hypothetical protein EA425_07785 [Puniceicoccaceae bacterium]